MPGLSGLYQRHTPDCRARYPTVSEVAMTDRLTPGSACWSAANCANARAVASSVQPHTHTLTPRRGGFAKVKSRNCTPGRLNSLTLTSTSLNRGIQRSGFEDAGHGRRVDRRRGAAPQRNVRVDERSKTPHSFLDDVNHPWNPDWRRPAYLVVVVVVVTAIVVDVVEEVIVFARPSGGTKRTMRSLNLPCRLHGLTIGGLGWEEEDGVPPQAHRGLTGRHR
jgi:hypothetical protein